MNPSERNVYVPLAGPPQVDRPNSEIFQVVGEENIFRMIEDFYYALEQSSIRHLFPADMQDSSRKSAAFFVGLLGGPPRYHERYGNPALRARHLPFRIDDEARKTWLECFDRVLDEATQKYGFPSEHLPGFRHWLHEFSRWMMNTK